MGVQVDRAKNLHLVERWTRTGPNTLEYAVTIEDPTVWTRTWTVKQGFVKQSDQASRIYYEPRCYDHRTTPQISWELRRVCWESSNIEPN